MSKPSPIVAFMRARFEYVSCMFKGHKDEMTAKLKTDALQGILRQLTIIRSVSVADGIVLGKMLDDCPLSLDACDQIREAIQLKVDVGGTAKFAMSHGKQCAITLSITRPQQIWRSTLIFQRTTMSS